MWHSTFQPVADKITKEKTISTVLKDGQIMAAGWWASGDQLSDRFTSWKWHDADATKRRNNGLTRTRHGKPNDIEKQYLVYRGVPCYRRVSDDKSENSDPGQAPSPDTAKIGTSTENEAEEEETWEWTAGGRAKDEVVEEEEIPDMEGDDDDQDEIVRDGQTDVNYRSYNVYITYSNYYKTPRLYLQGYDYKNVPLTFNQMCQDIYCEEGYQNRVTSLEYFPPLGGVTMIEVHACNHGEMMKKLLDLGQRARESELQKHGVTKMLDDMALTEEEVSQDEEPEAAKDIRDTTKNLYMVLFLKLASNMMPTIRYDQTMIARSGG